MGKSQRDLSLTWSKSSGIYSITGLLGNGNKYLVINWELVRSGGNSGGFDYFVPGSIFGTSSIRIWLRLLKLEVTFLRNKKNVLYVISLKKFHYRLPIAFSKVT